MTHVLAKPPSPVARARKSSAMPPTAMRSYSWYRPKGIGAATALSYRRSRRRVRAPCHSARLGTVAPPNSGLASGCVLLPWALAAGLVAAVSSTDLQAAERAFDEGRYEEVLPAVDRALKERLAPQDR